MMPGISFSSEFNKRDSVDGGGVSATTAAATKQVGKTLWWYIQAWALRCRQQSYSLAATEQIGKAS